MRFEDKVAKLRIEKHSGRETNLFLDDVKKMCEGEAFEYIMGEVNFCGAKIDLSLRPMIPRPETEFWVGESIKQIKETEANDLKFLDLFSGSGNVGLAILHNIKESSVDFVEYDFKLKEQIEISINKNKINKSRTNIFIGDTFGNVDSKYDYIFAVPPYIPKEMKDEVMKELHAEPELSFFDKEDGFFYIKEVLKNIKKFLKEGGYLYMEFDITQRVKIEEIAKGSGFNECSFLKDPYGHECCLVLKNL